MYVEPHLYCMRLVASAAVPQATVLLLMKSWVQLRLAMALRLAESNVTIVAVVVVNEWHIGSAAEKM